MSGGGGGGGMPPPQTFTDPVNGQSFMSAQALNEEIADRQNQEKAKSDQALLTGANNQVANRDQFNTDINDVLNTSRDAAARYIKSQGYDPNMFTADINERTNAFARNVNNPYLSQGDASTGRASSRDQMLAAFDPNLGSQILNEANSGYASSANNQLDQIFTPGYAQTAVNDSWLDPAVNDVVAKQFNPLTDALGNAHRRGTLNDIGYQAALDNLTDKQATARSTVSGLGRNILNSERSSLNDYITSARGDANRITANTQGMFNPDTYSSGADNLASGYRTNFGGDLTSAVGATSFADLPGLLNAGGLVQGAVDPTATNPNSGGGVSDSYIAQQALANQKRGLGTTGAF